MTATAWAIKDWYKSFENWKTARVQRGLEYIKVPCGRLSEGYELIMANTDGMEVYGIFVALCQHAADLDCRGILADGGEALSPRRLAVRIRSTPEKIERAIAVLSDKEIGWLVHAEIPGDDRIVYDDDGKHQPPTTERNEAQQGATDHNKAQRTPQKKHTTQDCTVLDKTNTPPTPQGAKAGGGDSPSLQEIQKAWPSMPTPTAREVADLGLTAHELNELDQAADAIKPPLRDKSAWLLVNARKYAERKRKRKPPPVHGVGGAGPVADRTVASASGGEA